MYYFQGHIGHTRLVRGRSKVGSRAQNGRSARFKTLFSALFRRKSITRFFARSSRSQLFSGREGRTVGS